MTMHHRWFALNLALSAARSDHAAAESASLLQMESTHRHNHEPALPVFNETHDQVLIFTEGKTGSNTLQNSFEDLTQPHFRPKYFTQPNTTYPRHVKCHNGFVAKDFIEKLPQYSTVWLVKSVRFFPARTISNYFQFLCEEEAYGGVSVDYGTCKGCKVCAMKDVKDQALSESAWAEMYGELVKDFNQYAATRAGQGNLGHFNQSIGFHIDPKTFNHDEGRLLLERWKGDTKVNVVVLRVEDSASWVPTMQKMFKGYRTVDGNTAEAKWYADIYKRFQDTFRFSEDAKKLDLMAATDDDTLFYTQTEQDSFMSKNLPM